MRLRLEIDGAAAAEAAKRSTGALVDSAVESGVAAAKAVAPVRTGALKASIRRLGEESSESGYTVWYGSDLSYALAVEAGTARRPGKRYLAQSLSTVVARLTHGL